MQVGEIYAVRGSMQTPIAGRLAAAKRALKGAAGQALIIAVLRAPPSTVSPRCLLRGGLRAVKVRGAAAPISSSLRAPSALRSCILTFVASALVAFTRCRVEGPTASPLAVMEASPEISRPLLAEGEGLPVSVGLTSRSARA